MKKSIKITAFILACLFIILLGGSHYMFDVSLKTKVLPTDEKDAYSYLFEHLYLKNWVDSLNSANALRDTVIISANGEKLHGLYVHSASHSSKTALIVHGYTDNAIRMLMIGHMYNREMGYNILLPDLHAHGKSEGKYIQMGWKDRLDVLSWIDVGREIFGDTTRMVIHGISMGAATTMMVSGEQLPANVKCFVADCGYTSVWDEFKHKLKSEYGLPAFPILYTSSAYCNLLEGWSFKDASPLEQVKKCKLPMFFIHGEADTYVPVWMVYKLYDAKPGEKEIWTEPNVEHADMYWDHTQKYVEKTRSFVEKYIGAN